MVGPVLITTFRKAVIVDADDSYRRGTFPCSSPLELHHLLPLPKHDRDRRDRAAAGGSAFSCTSCKVLYYELTRDQDGACVTVADMRFGPRLFNATTVVPRTATSHRQRFTASSIGNATMSRQSSRSAAAVRPGCVTGLTASAIVLTETRSSWLSCQVLMMDLEAVYAGRRGPRRRGNTVRSGSIERAEPARWAPAIGR